MKNRILAIWLIITMLISTFLFVNADELEKQAELLLSELKSGNVDLLFEDKTVDLMDEPLDLNEDEKVNDNANVGEKQSNNSVTESGGLEIDWSGTFFPKFVVTPKTYTFSMPLTFNYDAETGRLITNFVCENTTDTDIILKGFEISPEGGWVFVNKNYDLKNSLVNSRFVKVTVDGQYITMQNQGYNTFTDEIELPVGSIYSIPIVLELGAFNSSISESFISFKVYGEGEITTVLPLPLPELNVLFPDILDQGFGIFPDKEEEKWIPEVKFPDLLDVGFGIGGKSGDDKEEDKGTDIPEIQFPGVLDPKFTVTPKDEGLEEESQVDGDLQGDALKGESVEDLGSTEDKENQEDSEDVNSSRSEDPTDDDKSTEGTSEDNSVPEVRIPENLDLDFVINPNEDKEEKEQVIPEIKVPDVFDPDFGVYPSEERDEKDHILPKIEFPSILDPHFGFIPKKPSDKNGEQKQEQEVQNIQTSDNIDASSEGVDGETEPLEQNSIGKEETQHIRCRYTEADFEFLTDEEIANLTDEELELYLLWLKKRNSTIEENSKHETFEVIEDDKFDKVVSDDDYIKQEPVDNDKIEDEKHESLEVEESKENEIIEPVEDYQKEIAEVEEVQSQETMDNSLVEHKEVPVEVVEDRKQEEVAVGKEESDDTQDLDDTMKD